MEKEKLIRLATQYATSFKRDDDQLSLNQQVVYKRLNYILNDIRSDFVSPELEMIKNRYDNSKDTLDGRLAFNHLLDICYELKWFIKLKANLPSKSTKEWYKLCKELNKETGLDKTAKHLRHRWFY